MKLKKKGSVEFVDLKEVTGNPVFEGVRVGLKHVGPGQARAWSLKLQGLHQREMQRIISMRKGVAPSEAPELYERDSDGNFKFSTEDGNKEALEFAKSVISECIACIQGVEDYEKETDVAKLVDLIEYFGVADVLMRPALAMQNLKIEQSFLSESSPAGTQATARS